MRTAAAGVAGIAGGHVLGGAAAAGAAGAGATGAGLAGVRLVFLSHVNDPATTSLFPGDPEFTLETVATIPADGFYMQYVREGEHTGTHWGAPGHFQEGGLLADQLDPGDLFLPAVKIDVRAKAAADPDYGITVDDLRAFERRHGRIPRGAAVLMYSGWAEKVGDPAAYRNPDASGTLHFPGFGAEATEWLLRRRGIRAIGVDTLSIDPGNSTTFETHLILSAADRYGLENLANLDRIPRRGATIVVGLIPYEEGSGGQARIFASW